MSDGSPPIRVALVNDYEVIVEGIAAMLAPFDDRVAVIELDVGNTPTHPVDIALFDTFAGRRSALQRVRRMVDQHHVRRVVLYTWDVPDAFADELVEAGIDAVILKSTSGADLVDALERVGRDERPDAAGAPARSSLTEREQEVLVMLSEGMSNREIADELYLSVDTVKTHVRKLFRKLGVSNRTQAAMIAVDVGLTRQRLAS